MKPSSRWQILKAIQRYTAIPYRRSKKRGKPTAFVLGFSTWKNFISEWLPGYNVVRRDREITPYEFRTSLAPMLLSDPKAEVFIWGYKIQPMVEKFCRKHGIPITKVEDGFIRSVALGATKAPPLSLCMDRKALYFDATQPSTLEDILATHDFESDQELIARARKGIEALIKSRLSKYNVGATADISAIYGPKTKKRVLVVGQVEGDMSIKKGCDRPLNNNDLVWIAAAENPDAQIIYKPHPEILHKTRPALSNPRDVEGIAQILTEDISLADAFESVDHVYTITSLAGFEALIRGIEVTCAGAPFYSGWGLTNDLQKTPRRNRVLTIEQLFAGAYILYPVYHDPNSRRFITFEQALSLLDLMKKSSIRKMAAIQARKAERMAMEAAKIEATQARKAERVALASALKSPQPQSEVKIEAIRAVRRPFGIIDPPLKPPIAARSAPKKVDPKPKPKKVATRPAPNKTN